MGKMPDVVRGSRTTSGETRHPTREGTVVRPARHSRCSAGVGSMFLSQVANLQRVARMATPRAGKSTSWVAKPPSRD
jgi:hypothetical protein